MKVEKIITLTEAIDIEITGVRLLTKEEVAVLPKRLRSYHHWWWTSSADADTSNLAFYVNGDLGYIYGDLAALVYAARPALIFKSSSLNIGDRISVAGLDFEVIKDSLAFCLSDIGNCAFREDWKAEDANQYEKSDIKKFVDNWFKENVK